MSTPVSTERIIECLRETNGLVSLAAKRVPCAISSGRAAAERACLEHGWVWVREHVGEVHNDG